jgi:hypothetical protein
MRESLEYASLELDAKGANILALESRFHGMRYPDAMGGRGFRPRFLAMSRGHAESTSVQISGIRTWTTA